MFSTMVYRMHYRDRSIINTLIGFRFIALALSVVLSAGYIIRCGSVDLF